MTTLQAPYTPAANVSEEQRWHAWVERGARRHRILDRRLRLAALAGAGGLACAAFVTFMFW